MSKKNTEMKTVIQAEADRVQAAEVALLVSQLKTLLKVPPGDKRGILKVVEERLQQLESLKRAKVPWESLLRDATNVYNDQNHDLGVRALLAGEAVERGLRALGVWVFCGFLALGLALGAITLF